MSKKEFTILVHDCKNSQEIEERIEKFFEKMFELLLGKKEKNEELQQEQDSN